MENFQLFYMRTQIIWDLMNYVDMTHSTYWDTVHALSHNFLVFDPPAFNVSDNLKVQ